MSQTTYSEEQLIKSVDLYRKLGSKSAVADHMGTTESSIRRMLKAAARRGLAVDVVPIMPGFEIKSVARKEGEAWVKQAPAAGEEFVPPDGHRIAGVSALVDADNRIIQQWVKTKEDGPALEDKLAIIEKAFENFVPSAPELKGPIYCTDDRLTVYILCDWHIGLFAYGKETGGPDWDLSIAKKELLDTFTDVVMNSAPSSKAIVLGLGDLMHADNSNNMTARSGNVLDVDTRYAKVLETTCDMMVEVVEMVRRKHEFVEVVIKPGNHDPESTVGIRQALRMYYRNEPKVDVDTSPNPFYWCRFGVNLIGGTHGDKARPKDMPLIMANMRKQDWAETSTRHFHTGHVHHDSLKETGGVHVFTHRAPMAQDAYHASHGYLSGRSMKSYSYHATKGARGSFEVEIN